MCCAALSVPVVPEVNRVRITSSSGHLQLGIPRRVPAGRGDQVTTAGQAGVETMADKSRQGLAQRGSAFCQVGALRYVIYGASPMPRTVIERAIAVWGQHRFWQYYGQTEVPLCLAVLRPEDHVGDRLGACGQPALEVELRLLDESGAEVPAGQPGEIAVRAPSAVAGYHAAPELTAQTFKADGWVLTRDVGVFDEHGFCSSRTAPPT